MINYVCVRVFVDLNVCLVTWLFSGDCGENSKGEQKSEEEKVASSTGGVEFDLNQPMKEAGSSNADEINEVPESVSEEKVVEQGKELTFDLNELPVDVDDELN